MTTIFVIIALIFMGLTFGWVEKDIIEHTHEKNRTWHIYKALFQGFLFFALGYDDYGIHAKTFLTMLMYLALTVLIFNPVINKVRKRGDFFYISKNGIEGAFYKTPKLYYLLNLTIAVACYYLINYRL